MVIVILAILVAASTPFITTVLNVWVSDRTERDIVFNARLALNRMVREIRQIKNSTDYITTWTGTEFNFTDIKNDTIDFRQSSGSHLLLRNNDELTNMLSASNGLNFTYLDSSGNVAVQKRDIRMVRVILNLVSGENTISVESLARFRNIK